MRTLADLELAGTAVAGSAFAEKLGLWVSFTDAIALSALHSQPPANTQIAFARKPSAKGLDMGAVMGDEIANVRTGLVNLITQRGALAGGKAYIKLPEPPDASPVGAAAFEPYRRFYAAHQREMEASLGPLRTRVRALLSKNSPALKQLAALDAALDTILCDRESKLLTKVASLLQKRFMHLFRTHQQALQASGQTDKPELWMKNGAWLARFCHELQTVLLAELDLRLQPTLGLLEAYQNETQPTI
ncbi:MAG: hypothetical protein CFE43_02500 [Burkholderiales bacterium PBB3]|nr:MAG: hypothetical protein CFE43_02500 [Burkholderiales bacterium PBB3]